jgi:serine O-acetyltransferase
MMLTSNRPTDPPVAAEPDPQGTRLLECARELNRREPLALLLLRLELDGLASDTDLLAAVLAAAAPEPNAAAAAFALAREVLHADPQASASSLCDVAVTTAKNFEPGGEIATLLFSRGIHAILAHRVAHALWQTGRRDLALAVKTLFGRTFSTDIHPGAVFGPGVWLDHGLGFVVGETAVIEANVNIWHGVTLGSSLKQAGACRHPRLRHGCTIGAGAVLIGGIEIGANGVVGAGAVVLDDVLPGVTVAGVPARAKSRTATSFAGF